MLEIPAYPSTEFEFIGGNLALDFSNTVGGDRPIKPSDYLVDYPALVAWSRQAGLLTEGQAIILLTGAKSHPNQANPVLYRANRLREAIYRIFLSKVKEMRPREADLELLNTELSRAAPRLRLIEKDGQFSREWEDTEGAFDQMLGPIAQSAADLLTSGELDRVRMCAGDSCGWLFVDRTRNHSRRWCDMKDCGNVAKVRSYRSRKKSEI